MSALEMAVFNILTFTPQCILFGWYNIYVAQIKRPLRYIVCYVVLSETIVFLNDMGIISRTVRMFGVYSIFLFLSIFFVSKNSRMLALVTTFVNTMLTVICEAVTTLFYYAVTSDYEWDVFNHPDVLLLGRTIFCVIYAIVGNIFCHFLAKGKKVYERKLTNVLVLWFVMQYICLLYFAGKNNWYILNTIWNLIMCILVCVICIFSTAGMYFYLTELDRVMDEARQKEWLVVQMENQGQREAEIWADIQNADRIKENLMTGIQNAKNKLLERDASGSCESLEEIMQQMQAKELYCKNRVVDALLSTKGAKCREKNILLDTDLNLENETGVQNVDLCIVIANLLDNAIRACEKNVGGNIRIAAKKKGKYLIIRQENSYDGEIENRKNGVISEHGLGLEIIEQVAGKYHGWMEVDRNKEKFITLVMLKI